jgi:methylated-DNA-protein-cysteine methyltransferase-like protein
MNDESKDEAPVSSRYERVYALVRVIPAGQVATYGQLARLAGCTARVAGYAMAAARPADEVPWQRVINSQGRVSQRREGADGDVRQRRMLEKEGVIFDAYDRVDLAAFTWPGPGWDWLEANGYGPGGM